MNQGFAPRAAQSNGVQIFQTVFVTFLVYLTIGMPLGVLPTYVNTTLGLGPVLAGIAVSAQSLATIFSRARVGQLTDRRGAKFAVTLGFFFAVISAAFAWNAALPGMPAVMALALILIGRLALGVAESWIGTGAITWAIGLVGPGETVRIISWNGIASYGGIAAGAPLGVLLTKSLGFWSLGASAMAMALIGLVIACVKRGVPIVPSPEHNAPQSVLSLILPYGCALALATTGFGVIAAFVSLLFESRHWSGGSACLTLFGLSFIASRLLFSPLILRHGGLRVTAVTLVVELLGLIVLWSAPLPGAAMLGAAITGFGFSPVFPALGVVAVGKVPEANRGAALGLFSVFFDVALGTVGPIAGLLVDHFGTASPFLLSALATVGSFAITAALLTR